MGALLLLMGVARLGLKQPPRTIFACKRGVVIDRGEMVDTILYRPVKADDDVATNEPRSKVERLTTGSGICLAVPVGRSEGVPG